MAASSPTTASAPVRTASVAGATLALTLLTALNFVNYIDRYVLAGVQEQIKGEFHVSDAQLGSLTFFFLLTYMVASPFTGWLGDRFPRKPMIVSAALFNIAVPVGAAMGFLTGGYVGEHFGWRMSFTVSAVPGIVIALLIAVFMREPARTRGKDGKPKLEKGAVLSLLHNPAYLCSIGGYAAVTFVTGGLSIWMPTFLQRMDGRSQSSSAFMMGSITVAGGLLGTIMGGTIAQRWSRTNSAALYLVPAWSAALAFFPALVCFFGPQLLHTTRFTIPALAVAIFLIFLGSGPVNAATVNAVQPGVRATALAGQLLIIHALGDASSPTVIGAISDHANLAVGLGSTLIALLVGSGIFFLGARFAKPLAHDLQPA